MSALPNFSPVSYPPASDSQIADQIESIPAHALGVLTVDLSAIADNWRMLSRIVGPGCAVAAVVKADAYGLGVVPVARALAGAGCRSFFVGTLEEGLEASAALDEFAGCTIALLHGLPGGSAEALAGHDLVPVLNRAEEVAAWCKAAPGRPAMVQLDSGMCRLGLDAAELDRLQKRYGGCDSFTPSLILSHLGCADEPDHPMNLRQHKCFERLASLLPKAPLSLAASSGVFLGSNYHYQMVRIGAALWGLNPTPGRPNPMRQVVGLKARLLQVREIDRGESVGYGATYTANGPRRVATVGVGYADGILRASGNRARAFIGPTDVPVIGRISMDLMTLDVTAVEPDYLRPGQLVDLLGSHYDIDDLARESGTIGYELLTRLSRRLPRVYLS